MAISTYKTFFMKGTTSGSTTTWEKVCCIKSFSDIGGEAEKIPTTTLCNKYETSINGVQSFDAIQFVCNYTATDFQTAKALEGTENSYAVWFGGTENSDGTLEPTGSDGKFEFKGYATAWVNGGGVNEVVEFTISVNCSSDIQFSVAQG